MSESTYDITVLPDDPYYQGEGGREPDQFGLPISIDGRPYIVDLSQQQFTRRSVQLLSQQSQDQSDEQSLVSPEVWRRLVESWHQGAQQKRVDRKASLPYRFSTSRGVNVWDKWQLSLLNDTTLKQAIGTLGRIWIIPIGGTGRFIVIHGSDMTWYVNMADAAPITQSNNTPIVDACSDGGNLYVLGTDGEVTKYVTSADPGSLFATVSGLVTARAMLRYVKGFLIVGSGNSLYDISTGVPVLIYQHPLVDYHWVDAAEGLSVAYVLGGIGDKWHVSRMGIKSDATTLDPPIVAAPLPEGEIGFALGAYLGYVVVGLNTGWRFGVPASDGSLTFGKLVETVTPVRCFEGQDRFVWFGLGTGTLSPSQRATALPVASLGRADLSTFVEPLTPAAAADLGSTALAPLNVWAVATVGAEFGGTGKRIFAVDGVGVFLETNNKVAEGWLEQGQISMGTNDPKMGAYIQINTQPLAGGIDVDVSYDGLPFTLISENDRALSISSGNIRTVQEFRFVDFVWTLRRSTEDLTLGPVVTRIEFRALPIPGRSTEWRIPLVIAESINYDNVSQGREIIDDYDFLVDIVESRRQFIYREGQRRWLLHGTDFLWQPANMTLNGETYNGVFTLVARELR